MTKVLTDEQRATRTARQIELLALLNARGQTHGEDAAKLAVEIEAFEWKKGGIASSQINMLFAMGKVKDDALISTVTAMMDAIGKFD